MKKTFLLMALCLMMAACERGIGTDGMTQGDNVTLLFTTSTQDVTRVTVSVGDYFTKLNVMLFNADGTKAFDKVRTQYATDEGFGQLSLALAAGTYKIVAVGHSSIKSATIKSTEMVQFTASDGEKLTDTFCYCGTITVGEAPEQHNLVMNRVSAMVQFKLTDEEVPAAFARMKFDDTGGSANFNPTTFEGTTKSTQSENRAANAADVYQVYTFPYMAVSGSLKMTVTALDEDGNALRTRTFEAIPVTRNKITTYTGHFFEEGDGEITQSGFGFTVNGEWDEELNYNF